MGNEHSKSKEQLNRNGGLPEKHRNGSANGLSANVSSNGMEIAVNGDTTVQLNSEPLSSNPTTESNDFVIVESGCKSADAPVMSVTIEPIIQKEEVKESNEDQTDVSLPAQTESTSSGEEAAAVIIAVHRENVKCPHRKAEISTQTNRKIADISTQTGQDDDDDDDDTTTDIEGPVEEVVAMEAAATEEDPLNESYCVILDEFVEETANEEPVDNQTTGIINEDLVMESIVYKNIVFRAKRVTFSDIKTYDPEEESVNGCDETEPDIAAEPDSIIEDEIVAEENNIEESLPFEDFYSLPKVVADCVKMVFAAVPQATGFAAVKTAVPIAEEVTAEDNGEGAGDMSVDVVLTETAEPQSNKLVIIEELPEDTLSSPDAVKPESIPEDRTTDEKADVGEDAIADVGSERYEKTEPSPVFVQNNAELMLEAAIDALSKEFEPSNLTPQEAAVDNGFHLEEEMITASTYVALSGEQEAIIVIPEELVETVADKTNDDAIEASSNEIEAVPESVEEDTTNVGEEPADVPPMDAHEEPEPCVSIQEELKDENVAPTEVPTDSNHDVSEVLVKESLSLLEHQPKSNMPMVILQKIEDEMPPMDAHEEPEPCIPIQEELKDENVATAEVPTDSNHVIDADLEAIVEEIITEDVVTAERNLVTSEEEATEVIVEGETESSVNSTDSTPDSQRKDTEALAVRLQLACLSVVDESASRLGGLILPTQYSITVTIHVSPKQGQQ